MDEAKLERQLTYYFSDKNLWKDDWLRDRLGPDSVGWIDVKIIAGFKKISTITTEVDLVAACLKRIEDLEVMDDGSSLQVRRTRPLPPPPPPAEASNDGDEDQEAVRRANAAAGDPTPAAQPEEGTYIPGFRTVPKTGVIYVMDEAAKSGYNAQTAHLWSNLGQGSPETTKPTDWPTNVRKRLSELVEKGKLQSEKGPWNIEALEVNEERLHYGNVNGDLPLRQAVADYYNTLYRKGNASLYRAENVAIVGGGRAALTRICCAMENVNLGHFLPDYTAYAELLSQFKTINSIPILLEAENGFRISAKELRREIIGRGLSAMLISNPCNPTGQVIEGEELKTWVRIARDTQCSLILDEIYSRYIYTHRFSPGDGLWRICSAASFVEDVNKDPVVILDGLTKCWRMPGLRLCWIVGPKRVIDSVGAAGSFLDGGASLPTQRTCVPLLNPKAVIEQTIMLQALFSHKRDFLLQRLKDMGIVVEHPPQGTFYCWCDVSKLPPPLNSCWGFFREMLTEKVIVTPGVFFDVNPGLRRKWCSYETYVRISYGPSFKEVQRGLEAMQRVIERCRSQMSSLDRRGSELSG
mmetsp:Transcript_7837/g.18263  ORF Transcript_7837/g.18263 Transcript_7837/m.18263 type:complete len:581 (+) Transcript_7837:49-1791(+)